MLNNLKNTSSSFFEVENQLLGFLVDALENFQNTIKESPPRKNAFISNEYMMECMQNLIDIFYSKDIQEIENIFPCRPCLLKVTCSNVCDKVINSKLLTDWFVTYKNCPDCNNDSFCTTNLQNVFWCSECKSSFKLTEKKTIKRDKKTNRNSIDKYSFVELLDMWYDSTVEFIERSEIELKYFHQTISDDINRIKFWNEAIINAKKLL